MAEDFSDVNVGYGQAMYDLTQDGHVKYFVEHVVDGRPNGETIRWDWATGRFYVFIGHAWVKDGGGLVRNRVSESIEARLKELAQSKVGLDFLKTAGSANVQEGILKLMKKDSTIGRAKIKWNPNPELLGVANGVVDLRTGVLRNGQPEDLININTGVKYKGSKAITKTWRKFISEITIDTEMADYLQRALGYSTTGHWGEHAWFLCHGAGRNGKSLLLEKCVLVALGEYGATVARKVLQKSRFADGTTGELLELNGVRFALASEFSGEIDEDRVKTLASGGKFSARRAYNPNSEQFWSITKLWVDTNHLPVINDDSEGFWRRLRAILFEIQFKLNPVFEAAMIAEREACLAWLVEGAGRYLEIGLPTPKRVENQVESYREESGDSAKRFSDACAEGERPTYTSSEVYNAYMKWCLAEGTPERELLRRRVVVRRLRELRPAAHRMVRGAAMWAIKLPRKVSNAT
jgi:putative DNA primase/helicase